MEYRQRACSHCAGPVPANRRECPACGKETYSIALLFVHGIGVQERSQTLAEFGEPVFEWLKDRFSGLDERWRIAIDREDNSDELLLWRDRLERLADDGFDFDESQRSKDTTHSQARPHPVETAPAEPEQTQIDAIGDRLNTDALVGRVVLTDTVVEDPLDPVAPAHSKLILQTRRLDQSISSEHWLLAESWWAETFKPPSFSEMARWGLRVIPWTIASHYGAQVRRAGAENPLRETDGFIKRTAKRLLRLGKMLYALFSLLIGVLLSPVLLLVFALLLVVSLIPIRALRESLLNVQLQLASTMGDSYTLLSHPVYAASIVGKVRRDIDWLAERSDAVIVVAHSQGGAVVHKAAQQGINKKQRLMFTFGSGLKKLEQIKHLLSEGRSYRFSALLSLIALPICALSLAWFAVFGMRIATSGLGTVTADMMAGAGLILLYLVPSGAVVIAALRDPIRGFTPPALKRWTEKLSTCSIRWSDCYASSDPVSNGELMNSDYVKSVSHRISNLASPLLDHTTYWDNRDQFITLLMQQLGSKELRDECHLGSQQELQTSEYEWVSRRRNWRVGILHAISRIFWLSVFVLWFVNYKEVNAFINYAFFALVPFVDDAAADHYTIAWPVVLQYFTVAALFAVGQITWRHLNKREMRMIVMGGPYYKIDEEWVTGAIAFQVGALVISGFGLPGWIALLCGFCAMIVPGIASPKTPASWRANESGALVHPLFESPKVTSASSEGERAWQIIKNVLGVLGAAFGLGALSWGLITWLWNKTLVHIKVLSGINPDAVSPLFVGALLTPVMIWLVIKVNADDQGN